MIDGRSTATDAESAPPVFCYRCGRRARVGGDVPECPNCGSLWKLARNAVGAEALIQRDDLVLLVRRVNEPWQGRWELPGGFMGLDEHPADAARREIAEELGVALKLTGVLGFYLDPYLDEEVEVVTFLGEVDGDLVLNVDEVSEARWFSFDELPAEDEMAARHAERLRDWLRVRSGETAPGLGFGVDRSDPLD